MPATEEGGAPMPVQITNTQTVITYTATNQTWIIAPGVNAGDGIISSFTGSTLVNYGNLLSASFDAALMARSDAFVHNMAGALMTGFRGIFAQADLCEIRNEGTIYG